MRKARAEGGEHGDRLGGALPDLGGSVGMLVGSDLIHQPSPRTGWRYRVRPVLAGRA